jgi:type I restriction enzyme M protein
MQMSNESSTIVQKLWNYCNVLRDDGVSYGDYVEQLTYLLFLKMADERVIELKQSSPIPEGLGWTSLVKRDGEELELHYRHILESLGNEKGMLGTIFKKAQNKIQDPAKLKRLLSLIEGETWTGMNIDVKGNIMKVC